MEKRGGKEGKEMERKDKGKMVRLNIIGDGNCLLHAIMMATDPIYQEADTNTRIKMGDEFREILRRNLDEFYPRLRNSMLLVENYDKSLERFTKWGMNELLSDRHFLGDEVFDYLSQFMGCDLIFVRLNDLGELTKISDTENGFPYAILINYSGGDSGHYDLMGYEENNEMSLIFKRDELVFSRK